MIPLSEGVVSLGVVVHKDVYAQHLAAQSDKPAKKETNRGGAGLRSLGTYLGLLQKEPQPTNPEVSSSTQRYLDILDLAPFTKKFLGQGKLVGHWDTTGGSHNLVQVASDYSYTADSYAGEGWRIIGDAGCA